jgi:hypothetical protein
VFEGQLRDQPRRVRAWILKPLNWYLRRRASGEDAESDLQEWWDILEHETEVSGVNGYRTANARHILAAHLEEMGRFSEALPLRRTQCSIHRDERGAEDSWTMVAELHLGFNLCSLGQYPEARQVLSHARDAFERTEGSESVGAARAVHLIDWIDDQPPREAVAD